MATYVGDAGANVYTGTAFKDDIDGQGGNDSLSGLDSNDSILGGDGNDTLVGGAGKDTMRGGLNDDALFGDGDLDRDQLFGDDGADLVVGNGKDLLDGGAGPSDYLGLYLHNLPALNVDLSSLTSGGSITFAGTTVTGFETGFISLTMGDDKVRTPSMSLEIFGNDGADTLLGGAGNEVLRGGQSTLASDADVMRGGDGDDLLVGGVGDRFLGGAGTNDIFEIHMSAVTDDFVANLGAVATGGTVNIGYGTVVAGCEHGRAEFGSGDDEIKTGSITGDDGVIVDGGGGNDTLIGGDGRDHMFGGQGNDVIKGGAGVDTAYYDNVSGALTIDLNVAGWQDTGGAGFDFLSGIERVNGGLNGDRIVGNAADNTFEGYGNADTLIGGLGNDTLNGGSGGFDALTDVDRLSGGAGQDVYNGGNGNDILVWSSTFHTTVAAPDLIEGLESGDIIHVKDIDADTTTAGDQAFTVVVGPLTGVAGQLALVYDGAKTQFRMDTNGDGAADGVFEAAGDHTAHTAFVL